MKTTFKYIASFSMILILLVSTLQFSLYKMECFMSGKTQVSVTDFGDCDQSERDVNSISQRCCDFNDITLDFDYDTENNFREFKVLNPLFFTLNFEESLLKPVFNKIEFNFYTNLPPPSGYELLKVVQVFRL
jgi:hypothetical protein